MIINLDELISQDPDDILYPFYKNIHDIIMFIYKKYYNSYKERYNKIFVDSLLSKFIKNFKDNSSSKDENVQMKYIVEQVIYLFIKYDEMFCTYLLGHFRNIDHLDDKYKEQDQYPSIFKSYVDEHITRKSYDSLDNVKQVPIDQIDSNKYPSIMSSEHILHPTKDYVCMGDMYEEYPTLMKHLIVCEFFDKNQIPNMYNDTQNYTIKRQIRDKINPANITKEKKHSNKIIGFSMILGGTASAISSRHKKQFKTKQNYYGFRITSKEWERKTITRKLLNYNYNYKKLLVYPDNDLVGIATTMKGIDRRTNAFNEDSDINIKLLDKKPQIKTKQGKSNRKEANTGIVCKSGPPRIRIKRLQKDIHTILNITLNHSAYVNNIQSLFVNDTEIFNLISKSLQIDFEDSTITDYSIPNGIPIIHFDTRNSTQGLTYKPYKKTTVKDLCKMISILLRYKEYGPMFIKNTNKTIRPKWFYNNLESNNKYFQIFN